MIGMPNIPGLDQNTIDQGLDALISFGGAFAIGLLFGDRWGVFNQFGVPVLLADNVTSVEYQNTSNVLSAPVEKGTFASYNKVQDPFTASVQMTKGGGDATARGLFIAQLEALSRSTLLFNVLTPEYVHRNVAITGFGYKRTPTSGNRIIIANLELKEVREVNVMYEQEETANPEDQNVVDDGEVQTFPVDVDAEPSLLKTTSEKVIDLWNRGIQGARDLLDQVPGIEVQRP